jgi:hypothetical protein
MPDDNNSSKPATKADLAALEGRFDARLETMEARLDARLEALKNSMVEAVRDSQTEILRAFERYASSEQIKFRRLQADLSNVDASTDRRLEIVEQRLMEIEKKLLLKPPNAA